MFLIDKVFQALIFAADKHKNQRRKDLENTPYINHPIEVANFLIKHGITDSNIIICALLHDTIEDTNTSFEEIKELFGEEIALTVRDCTDNKKLDKITRKKEQIEHAKYIRNNAKLVKLADKYSNISMLAINPPSKWSPEEIIGYTHWGYAVCKNLFGINEKIDKTVSDMFKSYNISENNLLDEVNKYYSLLESQQLRKFVNYMS